MFFFNWVICSWTMFPFRGVNHREGGSFFSLPNTLSKLHCVDGRNILLRSNGLLVAVTVVRILTWNTLPETNIAHENPHVSL